MVTSIAFPSESKRLERALAEIHGHTSGQRVQALLDIGRLCDELRESSPTADIQLQLLEEREQAENEIWRQFLKRHA